MLHYCRTSSHVHCCILGQTLSPMNQTSRAASSHTSLLHLHHTSASCAQNFLATVHPCLLRRCICTTHLHCAHKTSSPQHILAHFAVASAPRICTMHTKLPRHCTYSPTSLLHLHHASALCAQNFLATAHPRLLRCCICTMHLHCAHRTSSPQHILTHFAVASAPRICTVRTKLLRHSASLHTSPLHLHHTSALCAQHSPSPQLLHHCICTHLHRAFNIFHRHSSSTAASARICTVWSTSSSPQRILHHCICTHPLRALNIFIATMHPPPLHLHTSLPCCDSLIHCGSVRTVVDVLASSRMRQPDQQSDSETPRALHTNQLQTNPSNSQACFILDISQRVWPVVRPPGSARSPSSIYISPHEPRA